MNSKEFTIFKYNPEALEKTWITAIGEFGLSFVAPLTILTCLQSAHLPLITPQYVYSGSPITHRQIVVSAFVVVTHPGHLEKPVVFAPRVLY